MFFDILPVVRCSTTGFFVLTYLFAKCAGGCQRVASRHEIMSETGDCNRGKVGGIKRIYEKVTYIYRTLLVWVFVRNMFHGYCDRAGYGLPSDHTEDRG